MSAPGLHLPGRREAPPLPFALPRAAHTVPRRAPAGAEAPPEPRADGGDGGRFAPLFWILRAGVAMEFIGHGALGLNRPLPWFDYFAAVGLSRDFAFRCMPLVGCLDLLIGALVLVLPLRPLVAWMTVWGAWTALLRPLAHEPFWEAVERAGNYGAPLALLLLLAAPQLAATRQATLHWVLRLTTALLLLGHGALGWPVHKALLGAQYASVGLPASIAPAIGAFESALAFAVLALPRAPLLWFVLAWKVATELLSPVSGAPLWVFVEHGGSYAAPLALLYLGRLQRRSLPDPADESAAGLRS